MTLIFCIIFFLYLRFLNKYLFKGKLIDHPQINKQVRLSVIIGFVLIIVRFTPLVGFEPVSMFLDNTNIPSILIFDFIIVPIFFTFVISSIFFLPKNNYKLYYFIIVLIPFIIFWPKNQQNIYCKVELPANNAIRTWKGEEARFVLVDRDSNTATYQIYDIKTDKLLIEKISFSEFIDQNSCRGFSHDWLCSGVVITKCETPKDIANFNEVWFGSPVLEEH